MFLNARKGSRLIGQINQGTVLRTFTGSRGGKYAEVRWDDGHTSTINLKADYYASEKARAQQIQQMYPDCLCC